MYLLEIKIVIVYVNNLSWKLELRMIVIFLVCIVVLVVCIVM